MLYNEFLRLKYHVKTKACFILLFGTLVCSSGQGHSSDGDSLQQCGTDL